MKDTFFFTHDYNARNDPKLQRVLMKLGCAGLGIYWCIIEQLYEQGGSLPMCDCESIAFALRVEVGMVEKIVTDFDLFKTDEMRFWSPSVNTRLEKRTEIAQKRKNAALVSWESRRNRSETAADHANVINCRANKGNQIKEKNIKDRESTLSRFAPPSIQEVSNFITENKYDIDAEAFVSFYTSKNWYIGTSKMKDWRAAVVTWQHRNRREQKSTDENINKIWQD